MTVIRSVTRPLFRSMFSSVIRGDAAITRFFTDLTVAGSTHYTVPTISLTGNYNKTDKVYFRGSVIHIWGNSANNNNRCTINADGSITWLPDGSATSVSTAAGVVVLNKFNEIDVDRTSSTGTILVKGVSVFSGAVPTGTCTIDRIGRSNVTDSTGIIANDTTTDAGTLIRSYAINKNLALGTTIVDSISGQNGTAVNISSSELYTQDGADWLGVELWTLGDSVSSGSEGTFQTILSMPTSLTIGNTYRSTWTATGFTVGEMRFLYGTTQGINITVDGDYAETAIAAGSQDLRTFTWAVQPNAGASFIKQSVKRFLEAA